MKPEDQDALRKFNEEWDSAHTSDGANQPIDSKGGNVIQGGDPVGLADQLAQAKANLSGGGTYQPANIPTTGDTCPQCNVMHPPVRPGEVCKVAFEMGKVDKDGNPITPTQAAAPPVQPITEKVEAADPIPGTMTSEAKPVEAQPIKPEVVNEPQKIVTPPISSVEPEPVPLAENNIPTEVHVNKYLNSWGQMIEAHCKTHSIVNVKRLMRHLTVEITDFLEHNKGR